MYGIGTIVKKELADHFSSYRFIILFALIAMVSLITAYMVGLNIKEQLEGVAKPKFVFLMLFTSSGALFSLVQFVAFFGPLVGLVLGFDTINRERNQGTLSKLLSQPIFRDVVINGKFLAGVALITVPAAPSMWSEHDELHHHQRRYRRDELVRLVENSGLSGGPRGPTTLPFVNCHSA